MENRPPQQETPRRPPTSGRKTNGSGGSPTPPWLWLLLIGGFGLIFWQFVPKTETQVSYYPWFSNRSRADNIKTHLDPGHRDPRRAPQGADLSALAPRRAAAECQAVHHLFPVRRSRSSRSSRS